MNPFCPYCHVALKTKYRSWTDKYTHRPRAGKFWECPRCKRLWKKGCQVIMKGNEIHKRRG